MTLCSDHSSSTTLTMPSEPSVLLVHDQGDKSRWGGEKLRRPMKHRLEGYTMISRQELRAYWDQLSARDGTALPITTA